MPTETIIALCISACALVFTALSFRRNANNDSFDIVTQRATISSNLQYIRERVDEIKAENKTIQKDLGELKEQVVKIDESTKSAHKRLDDLMNKKG